MKLSHISCPECSLSLLFSAPLGVFNGENNRIRSLLQQNTTGKRKAKCETQNSSAERNAKRKTQAQNAKRNAKRKTQARSAKRKTVSFSASVSAVSSRSNKGSIVASFWARLNVVDDRWASWVFPCGSTRITVNTDTHAHHFCREEKWPPKCMEHYGDPPRSQQRSIFRENPTNFFDLRCPLST